MTSIMQTLTYPRYARYQDSGVEWLGEIPEGWDILKTKYIWTEVEQRSQNGSEILLSVSQYDGVTPNKQDSRSESFEGYKLVKKNNLVINIMLAWMGGLGISNYEGMVSPAYCVYELKGKHIHPKYLGLLYKTNNYLAEFTRRSSGIVPSRWRMYTDDFGQVPTLLPPIEEQNRIVNFLDQKTTAIDTAIAKKQRLIKLLKEQKAILINRAVTRGLNPEVPMKDSGVAWIGEIPAHWEVRRSKFLFNEIDERSETGQEELLSVSHLTGVTPRSEKNISMFMAENYSGSKLCQPGDLIINIMWAWMGALGVSTHSGIISPSYGVYRQKKLYTFNPWFLEHLLQSNQYVAEYNRRSTGLHSSRLRLYSHMFFDMELGFPSLKEQNQIEQITNEKLSKLHQIIQSTEKQIKKIQEYKQTLIAHAVTGKIKVS